MSNGPRNDGAQSGSSNEGSDSAGKAGGGSANGGGAGGKAGKGGNPAASTGGATMTGGASNVAGADTEPMAGAGAGGGEPALPTCEASPVPVGAAAIIQYPLDDATGTVAHNASASGADASLTGTTWDAKGHAGGAIKFSGEGQRMTIPSGVLETLDAITIMAWVKPSYASAASTLFDLGTDADNRFALEIGTSLQLVAKTATLDQTFPGAMALPTNRWNHVALTLGGGKAVAYVDGRPMVRGDVDLKPSDLGALAEVWIGQSHGTGTNTYGLVDQVELFDRVLEQREIMAGELEGADYLYFSFDELCPPETNAVPAEAPRGLTGQLPNGATLADGRLGKAIQLNAMSMQYVELPPAVIQDCTDDFTYAAWLYLTTSNKWGRLFDFGSDNTSYFYLTPNAEGGGIRFSATLGGNGAEQPLLAATAVPVREWHHFAVTIAGMTGRLYFDGAEIATSTQIAINPSDLGATTNNWLGRSQYDLDPYLNGRLDDVVISCRAFTADEIMLLANIAAP